MGTLGKLPVCVTVAESEVFLHNTVMPNKYETLEYENKGNGTWEIRAYNNKHVKKVTITVDTKVSPFTAKVVINAMGDKTVDCTKGRPYDNSLGA